MLFTREMMFSRLGRIPKDNKVERAKFLMLSRQNKKFYGKWSLNTARFRYTKHTWAIIFSFIGQLKIKKLHWWRQSNLKYCKNNFVYAQKIQYQPTKIYTVHSLKFEKTSETLSLSAKGEKFQGLLIIMSYICD